MALFPSCLLVDISEASLCQSADPRSFAVSLFRFKHFYSALHVQPERIPRIIGNSFLRHVRLFSISPSTEYMANTVSVAYAQHFLAPMSSCSHPLEIHKSVTSCSLGHYTTTALLSLQVQTCYLSAATLGLFICLFTPYLLLNVSDIIWVRKMSLNP